MTSPVSTPAVYCSDHSWAIGEPLMGTAPRCETVLVLEFNGRWEAKVLDSPGLPEDVREHLRKLEHVLPATKIWFVRRGKEPKAGAIVRFYVALVRESHPALYAFQLASYADLMALDIAAVVAESPEFALYRQQEPLVLVCTHGRRDRCCARGGQVVYERLRQELGPAVWQVSHVGGHRLGANVVTLPHGLYHGRTDRLGERWDAFVDALRTGQIALDAYRGRACYAPPVQAADFFARQASGLTAPDAWVLVSAEREEEGEWRIEFAEPGGRRHMVRLRAGHSSVNVYASCGDHDLERVIPLELCGYEVQLAR